MKKRQWIDFVLGVIVPFIILAPHMGFMLLIATWSIFGPKEGKLPGDWLWALLINLGLLSFIALGVLICTEPNKIRQRPALWRWVAGIGTLGIIEAAGFGIWFAYSVIGVMVQTGFDASLIGFLAAVIAALLMSIAIAQKYLRAIYAKKRAR